MTCTALNVVHLNNVAVKRHQDHNHHVVRLSAPRVGDIDVAAGARSPLEDAVARTSSRGCVAVIRFVGPTAGAQGITAAAATTTAAAAATAISATTVATASGPMFPMVPWQLLLYDRGLLLK